MGAEMCIRDRAGAFFAGAFLAALAGAFLAAAFFAGAFFAGAFFAGAFFAGGFGGVAAGGSVGESAPAGATGSGAAAASWSGWPCGSVIQQLLWRGSGHRSTQRHIGNMPIMPATAGADLRPKVRSAAG
ncbi:hypothetical protein A5735_02930 [Mycolicibacter heraklionensis]|nr:hypothetical protein A5735_02930 [Mycolicibacter heraklionensis]